MMARWLTITALVIIPIASSADPLSNQTTIADVEAADQSLNRAFERSDVEELRKMVAEQYVFTDPTGRVTHKQELLDGFAKGRIQIKSQTTQDVSVAIYSDVAVETGLLTSVAVRDGRNSGGTFRFTRVWAKIDGRWQTIAFQETAPK